MNPVSGAVGLLWTGNWNVCQSAVERVLCGGALQPLPCPLAPELDDVSESAVNCTNNSPKDVITPPSKRKAVSDFHDDRSITNIGRNLTSIKFGTSKIRSNT